MIISRAKSNEELREESKKIAEILTSTRAGQRGHMLLMIAEELRLNGTNYTAGLIQSCGHQYQGD